MAMNLGRFLELPPPETTIRTATGQFEVNPAYLPWHRQDQLLLGWLRSYLTETLLAQVVASATTRDYWRSLEDYYASTSRARLHELKRQVQTAFKGDSTCSDYLLRLRHVSDELAFIGAPLPEDELVSTTINGLDVEYNSIVVAVLAARCSSSFNFSDLRGLLLGHEALLQSQAALHSSAFYAGNGGNNRSRQQSHPSQIRPGNGRSSSLGSNSFPFPNGPHGSTVTNGSELAPRPICQICEKVGHIAKLCYRRYLPDPDWKPNPRFKAYATQSTHSLLLPTSGLLTQEPTTMSPATLIICPPFSAILDPINFKLGMVQASISLVLVQPTLIALIFPFNYRTYYMFLISLLTLLAFQNYFMITPLSLLTSLLPFALLRTSTPRILFFSFLVTMVFIFSRWRLLHIFSMLLLHMLNLVHVLLPTFGMLALVILHILQL